MRFGVSRDGSSECPEVLHIYCLCVHNTATPRSADYQLSIIDDLTQVSIRGPRLRKLALHFCKWYNSKGSIHANYYEARSLACRKGQTEISVLFRIFRLVRSKLTVRVYKSPRSLDISMVVDGGPDENWTITIPKPKILINYKQIS